MTEPNAQTESLPTRELEVTQARIDLYAELSGDFNPLHVDPEFAKQTPFGSTIAHGPLAGALLFQNVGAWLGQSWPQNVNVELTFVAPVRANDTVRAQGTVAEGQNAPQTNSPTFELACVNQTGTTVIVGTAKQKI